MRKWLFTEPLKGPDGSQWPFHEQPIHEAEAALFPSWSLKAGQDHKSNRFWQTPISLRAFQQRIERAVVILRKERAHQREAELQQQEQKPQAQHNEQLPQDEHKVSPRGACGKHPFEHYDLSKLGTHSMKKSSVTLLKSVCTSSAVVGAISGTSAATIDKFYDQPTHKRKIDALNLAFGTVFHGVSGSQSSNGMPKQAPPDNNGQWQGLARPSVPQRFCGWCGRERANEQWVVCPYCAVRFAD